MAAPGAASAIEPKPRRHAPERDNDDRNWHPHTVYSNVAVEPRPSGIGWTLDVQPGRHRPPGSPAP